MPKGYIVIQGLQLVVVLHAVAEIHQAWSQVGFDEREVLLGGGEQSGQLEALGEGIS